MIDKVDLGQELEGFVADLVSTEQFTSVDAVLRESVRLLEARERRRAEINAAIDVGLADAAAGRVVTIEEVFDRLEAELEAVHGLK